MLKIAIYGIGNFGYALLNHLDNKPESFNLHIYDRNIKVRDSLKNNRHHPKLHLHNKISDFVKISGTPQELVENADIIILAISSSAIREVARDIRLNLKNGVIILNTAKALEANTGKRISTVISEELGDSLYSQAILAGGTIASDLFNRQPLGATIASEDQNTLDILIPLFSSYNLFIYPSTDIKGVEYASAFKNMIAILAGIMNGKGFSYGSETHIISKAAHEIEMIVTEKLGGQKETFSMNSQCWGNDLWMSCTGNTRNREFGFLIGKGESPKEAEQHMRDDGKTVEGIETLRSVKKIATIDNYPLIHFLSELITKNNNIDHLESVIFNSRYEKNNYIWHI